MSILNAHHSKNEEPLHKRQCIRHPDFTHYITSENTAQTPEEKALMYEIRNTYCKMSTRYTTMQELVQQNKVDTQACHELIEKLKTVKQQKQSTIEMLNTQQEVEKTQLYTLALFDQTIVQHLQDLASASKNH
jgi:predicted class III extradiol MEMO1 family dioxygenase